MANIIARKPDFSDLDLDFIAHPTTGDVMKKTGNEAIKRSIRNLILTGYYDRVFRPGLGGDVKQHLFENVTSITKILLQDSIKTLLNAFEPRITLQDVKVEMDEDNNGFNVSIYYIIKNTNEPIGIGLFLERLR
jgi:uncharacterized protein